MLTGYGVLGRALVRMKMDLPIPYQDRHYTHKIIMSHIRVTIFAVEKHYLLHSLSVHARACVAVALIIQHAKRIRLVML